MVGLSEMGIHGISVTVDCIEKVAAIELDVYVKATGFSNDVHLLNVSSDRKLVVKVVCTREDYGIDANKVVILMPFDSR